MTLHDMMHLQGLDPLLIRLKGPRHQVGKLLGNAMSANVVERLFRAVLLQTNLAAPLSVDDPWTSSAGAQKLCRSTAVCPAVRPSASQPFLSSDNLYFLNPSATVTLGVSEGGASIHPQTTAIGSDANSTDGDNSHCRERDQSRYPGSESIFFRQFRQEWQWIQFLIAGDVHPHPRPRSASWRPAGDRAVDILVNDVTEITVFRYDAHIAKFETWSRTRDLVLVLLASADLPVLVANLISYLRQSYTRSELTVTGALYTVAAMRRYLLLAASPLRHREHFRTLAPSLAYGPVMAARCATRVQSTCTA